MKGRIVVIGASFNGLEALSRLVAELPADFGAPILIVQHVASYGPGLLPHILSKAGRLPALHPGSPHLIEAGHIYVAPPDRHMILEKGYVRLSHGPRENLVRPAIDPLFRSAALAYGPAVIGVVLTGELDDGTAGLLAIKDCGGTTIVQDPAEASAASMPRSALRHAAVDHCLDISGIARLLVDLVADDPRPVAPDAGRSLMQIENRIAAGVLSEADWSELERWSEPSGLNCPECRSALHEIRESRMLRFRCRSGHAFSAESLLSGQADAREMHLASLYGVATEEAALAKRMMAAGYGAADSDLGGRARVLEEEAEQVANWLKATASLGSAEPVAQRPGRPQAGPSARRTEWKG